MKLIIAGGRDYHLTPDDYKKLDAILASETITEVCSGKATGVDADGEFWARKNGISIRCFWADWHLHGKKAGPMRNLRMALYADALALFPGGRGTASMRTLAKQNGLKIYDYSKCEEQPMLL